MRKPALSVKYCTEVYPTRRQTEIRPDLPRCWKHPQRRCPGECQYILPPGECIHEVSDVGIATKLIFIGVEVTVVQSAVRLARNPRSAVLIVTVSAPGPQTPLVRGATIL
jgi:hypothetical protein